VPDRGMRGGAQRRARCGRGGRRAGTAAGARGPQGSRGGAAAGAGQPRSSSVRWSARFGGETKNRHAEKKPHARLSPSSTPRSVAPS
jgi:hypothetical protein